LSTVLGIGPRCGGCLELKSQLGRGTEVRIYLPAAAGATQPVELLPEPPAAPANWSLSGRDEALAAVVQKVLAASGYRVLAASDEAEAVELYRRNWRQIGVVLADLMMPDMERTIGALRRINPATVLVASATVSPGQLPPPCAFRTNYSCANPIKTGVLLDTLRSVLRLHAPSFRRPANRPTLLRAVLSSSLASATSLNLACSAALANSPEELSCNPNCWINVGPHSGSKHQIVQLMPCCSNT